MEFLARLKRTVVSSLLPDLRNLGYFLYGAIAAVWRFGELMALGSDRGLLCLPPVAGVWDAFRLEWKTSGITKPPEPREVEVQTPSITVEAKPRCRTRP